MFSLSDLEAMVKWSIKCVACLFCLFFAFISLMVWRIMALPSNKVWLYEKKKISQEAENLILFSLCENKHQVRWYLLSASDCHMEDVPP